MSTTYQLVADGSGTCTAADTGPPGSPTHAVALARSLPLSTYSTLLSLSGDGIIHELLNGLATHSSGHGKKALRETTLCHVPCGSGNALASSLVGSEKVEDVRWCALAALKGASFSFDFTARLFRSKQSADQAIRSQASRSRSTSAPLSSQALPPARASSLSSPKPSVSWPISVRCPRLRTAVVRVR